MILNLLNLIRFGPCPSNISESIDRLCYRYPSALVDAVTEHEPGKRLVAVKNVTVNEDFFQGHFPGTPLMPGVLMIETLAQVATLLLVHGPDGKPSGHAYLRGVDDAKFRRQVVPGDRLRLEVTLGARRSKLARAHAVASIGDAVVAEAELVMALVPERVPGGRPGVTVDPDGDRPSRRGDWRRLGRRPARHHRRARPHRPRLPHRRVQHRRRVDRDRRRQPDLPVCLDWADPAGPEVPRREDDARHWPPQRLPRVRHDSPRHGGWRRHTDIGDNNVFMAYAHVAHDCHIGNSTIFGNAATLGGHVTVEDFATISAFSGVHQFCRVGLHAFIGGYSVVTKDALPYAKTVGNRARIYGINTIGLERRKFSKDSINQLRRAFRYLLHSNTSRALAQIDRDPSLGCAEVQYLLNFIRSSSRGVGLRRPSRRLEEVMEE